MYIRRVSSIWICLLLLCCGIVEAETQWQNGTAGSNETTRRHVLLPSTGAPVFSASRLIKANNLTQQLTTGSGLAYASECNSAKIDWYLSWGSSLVSTTTFQTSTQDVVFERSTWFTTTTSLAPGATPYTLCDGYTRIDGTTNFSMSVYVTSSTTMSTFETATEVYVNVTAPPCMIQSSDCAYLNSSYSKASTAYSKWRWSSIEARLSTQTFTAQPPPEPSEAIDPICGIPPPIPGKTTSLIPPVCIVNTAHVQLLYWPVKTASDCDLCDMDHCATQTPTPTIAGAPNTAVAFNTTLTSPTVYIAFEGELIGKSDGQSFSDVKRFLVPQSSTAISSYCGKIGGGIEGTPHSFNYAHLNGIVPAGAYRCQPRCFSNPLGVAEYTTTYTSNGSLTTATSVTWSDYATENLCSTIWNDYDPMLSIPPELSTILFSEGSSGCNFTAMPEGILFDPPLALTEADHAVKPTAPAPNPAEPTPDATLPTAKPGGTPDTTLPSPTGGSEAEQASPTGNGAPTQGGNDGNSDGAPTESPPSQDDGANVQAPAPQTTTRNIGGIIASAFGMTQAQNDPTAEPSPAKAQDQPPQPTVVQSALNGDPPQQDTQQSTGPAAHGPAPVAILTNSNNEEVTVFRDPTVPVLVVGSTTLPVGETLSLPNVGNVVAHSSAVVIDGSSVAFHSPPTTRVPTVGAIVQGPGGETPTIAQISSDRVVVGDSTIDVGEPTSIAGMGNLVAETNAVVIGGITHAFSVIAEPSNSGAITAGGNTFTAGSNGEFTIAPGQVLRVGMTTSVSGIGNIVLQSNAVVIDGTTHTVTAGTEPSSPATITASGHTFTMGSDGKLTIAPGQVLTPGGEVVVSGTTYSLDTEGSIAVVNGVSHIISAGRPSSGQASATTAGGATGDGSSSQPTPGIESTSGPLTQTSTASRGRRNWGVEHMTSLLCLWLIILLCI